jgi:hypothetical protein
MTATIAAAVAILLQIESGGEPNPDSAIGDGTDAVGCLQMHAVAVHEANRIVGYERWTLGDRLDREKSLAMCRVTLEWHYRRGVTDVVDLACRWNRPNGERNEKYRDKVKERMER